MLPVQIAGLALSGGILLSKYGNRPLRIKYRKDLKIRKFRKLRLKKIKVSEGLENLRRLKIKKFSSRQGFENLPKLKLRKINVSQGLDNLQRLANGISSILAKPAPKPEAENYDKIAAEFLPEGANFVKPKYPADSGYIQAADLDRDSVNELIGTYTLNGRLHTMILKKAGNRWIKTAEIHHDEQGQLNYRGFANLYNDGKLHMLLGISGDERSKLHAYSLWDGKAEELFAHPYNGFEVIGSQRDESGNAPARLAIWEKDEDGVFDVKVHRYNGSLLEEETASPGYWKSRIFPEYVALIRKDPYSPEGWYKLAKALMKAGLDSDAEIAIETGSRIDEQGSYSDKFSQLRKMLQ